MEKLEIAVKRRRGRPKLRWREKVREDLTKKGWTQEYALDRRGWRDKIKRMNADHGNKDIISQSERRRRRITITMEKSAPKNFTFSTIEYFIFFS